MKDEIICQDLFGQNLSGETGDGPVEQFKVGVVPSIKPGKDTSGGGASNKALVMEGGIMPTERVEDYSGETAKEANEL